MAVFDSHPSTTPSGGAVAPSIAEVDVAIVGGGIAGLTAMYRLLTHPRLKKSGWKILLFEAQDRLGGRLLSINIPGVDLPAELGAMRYNAPRHTELARLIKDVGLEEETLTFDIGKFTGYYLRGRRFQPTDLNGRTPCPRCGMGGNFCSACGAPLSRPYILSPRKEPTKGWEEHRDPVEEDRLGSSSATPPDPRAEEFAPATPDELIRSAILCVLRDLEFSELATAADLEEKRSLEIQRLAAGKGIDHANWHTLTTQGQLRYDPNLPAIPLASTGFWNILQHYLRNEGFLLAHDGSGYESIVSSWNAAEAMEWFAADIGGINTDWRMLRKGYRSLCDKLEAKIQHAEPTVTPIYRRHVLGRIEKRNSGAWRLYFEPQSASEAGDTGPSSITVLDAQHVILALPAEPLKSITVNHPTLWDHQFRQTTLRSVRQHRMFKVFLVFKEAWWRDLLGVKGAHCGRVFTDLPIRQVYYYSPEWIEAHMGKSIGGKGKTSAKQSLPIVMASYSDSHYVGFWRPFLGTRVTDEESEAMLREYEDYLMAWRGQPVSAAERRQLQELTPFLAPKRMQDKIVDQLAEVHGVDPGVIGSPILGVYQDWGRETYNVGGWHTWEVNYSPEQIIALMAQPQTDERLYICGEAYSTQQGWVEGAVHSAQEVVRKLVGSLPPES